MMINGIQLQLQLQLQLQPQIHLQRYLQLQPQLQPHVRRRQQRAGSKKYKMAGRMLSARKGDGMVQSKRLHLMREARMRRKAR